MCSLIRSPRLRPGDLEVWRRLELVDLLYAQRYRTKLERMADKAKAMIADFLRVGPAYCSVSWGKDSVVVADLCRNLGIPIVFIRVNPTENPDSLAVRDAFVPANYYEIWTEWQWEGQHWKPIIPYGGFKKAAEQFGTRRVTGIRKQESQSRRLRGSANTQNSCVPIARWTTQEVFAYLQLRSLPIHPAYAMGNAGQFDRNHLRVDAIGEQQGTQFDRRAWENLYYGDILWKSSICQS